MEERKNGSGGQRLKQVLRPDVFPRELLLDLSFCGEGLYVVGVSVLYGGKKHGTEKFKKVQRHLQRRYMGTVNKRNAYF